MQCCQLFNKLTNGTDIRSTSVLAKFQTHPFGSGLIHFRSFRVFYIAVSNVNVVIIEFCRTVFRRKWVPSGMSFLRRRIRLVWRFDGLFGWWFRSGLGATVRRWKIRSATFLRRGGPIAQICGRWPSAAITSATVFRKRLFHRRICLVTWRRVVIVPLFRNVTKMAVFVVALFGRRSISWFWRGRALPPWPSSGIRRPLNLRGLWRWVRSSIIIWTSWWRLVIRLQEVHKDSY